MGLAQNKQAVRRYCDEVIGRGNLDLADELIAPGFVDRSGRMARPGPQGAKTSVAMFRKAFPDLCATVDDLVAEGDKVAARLTMRGTHAGDFFGIPPTGRRVAWTEMVVLRFSEGQMVEQWAQTDIFALLEQIGAHPTLRPAPGVVLSLR